MAKNNVTRATFKAAAARVAQEPLLGVRRRLADVLCEIFHDLSDRFDETKFREACKTEEGAGAKSVVVPE